MDPGESQGKRVIVADDDAQVREVIGECLTRAGYEVLEAANGLEVLLHVKHSAPAAVVLDLRMPRLGGLEALTRIHAFNSAIKVVVVTAVLDPDVRQRALAMGADAVLEKPVALEQLLTVLGRGPAPPAPAVEIREATIRPAPEPPAAPVQVLIVDDDEGVLAMLEEFLTKRGYHARAVTNAADALRSIAERAPAVVLLDIAMPRLSGSEALPAIRALAPNTAVIMVSAIDDAALARETLARGAFDYIVKPIDFGYLAQSLEAALDITRLGGEGLPT
jgi:DNA-binding NtrC family response regulator